ncbi:MAG: tetratricopeptide repeat protein [Acetatifactor muris]|nr:tetratricopeptide repeat protein [Acetatifactor muris]
MDRIEVFQILGIEMTKDEKSIKNAYRERLAVTNPEDNPQGFKRLREAYEEACRLAKEPDEKPDERRDETVSGLWVEKAAAVYGNLRSRRDVKAWEELFADDCFLSLEEEDNCRIKLLRFIMDHFRLPGDVWKLLDRKLGITADAGALREKFPADFIRYVLSKCERGEDIEFDQFEGEEEAPYDLFLQYYDRCWQALQNEDLKQAQQNIESADALKISHPVMEVCRAELLEKQGRLKEAVALIDGLLEKYPKDAMVCYNAAEMFWRQGQAEEGFFRRRAAEIYKILKDENDGHYMANVRLTEWYYDNQQFKEAKKCAEKVLSAGSGDEFMELLCKVNHEIEKDLEEDWRKNKNSDSALELCWCYLQDGKISGGIRLALQLEKLLPEEKEAEWNGLMAKLYVEEAEYETSITMTHAWEETLEKKLLTDSEEEREKDRDRLKQAHLIRMQCFHNLGFKEEAKFGEAVREAQSVLEGNARDIGILLEMAQIYTEMQEYEKCEETVRRLVEDYQVYAAYAALLEAYRRQLNPGGVIRTGSLCIQYFSTFVKPYEYMAKVYLDLEQPEELKKLLEDAEKNGVKSDVLEAYKYQGNHKTLELDALNKKLKAFRKDFRKPVEEGKLSFYESGLPILTEYIYNCPDSYMFVERGIFHRAAHHYREAREDFEKALALNPSNPYALNGLSFVYRYTGEYEKALFYIKKAILYMDEEMSPVIYTDMADLYSLLGDFEMSLAACRQYEEITKERNRWFINQMAELCVNLGRAEEACEYYKKSYAGDRRKLYGKCAEAYIQCGEEKQVKRLLAEWSGKLKIKSDGPGKLFSRVVMSQKERGEAGSFYLQTFWAELVFGEKKNAAAYAAEAVYYYRDGDGEEGTLSDAVFACIVCGMDKLGKKYGEQLKRWLQSQQFSGENKYFNREKAHLQKEVLAAWYTKEEDEIQALLDREPECGICHFCTSTVCREMESLHILFLIRKGKREEAEERLLRSLERQPSDEYMRAIKHNVFGD